VQLLIRRCRLIVAIDSGHDPQHDFADLANALRLARVYHGIRIAQLTKDSDHEDAPVTEWNLGDLNLQRAGANDQSLLASALQLAGYPGNLLQTVSHFSAARILYPEHDAEGLQDNGLLILVKPSITGDESPDILQYRASSPAFPQDRHPNWCSHPLKSSHTGLSVTTSVNSFADGSEVLRAGHP
jgi:hypothetical protein